MPIYMPYGKTEIPLFVPLENLRGVLVSQIEDLKSDGMCEDEIVISAMSSPIGSLPLFKLAVGKKNATIIISDHTRPVPSKRMIPHMLSQLREGNPDINITLLVATGCHRGMTKKELVDKLGNKIVEEEKIIVHDSLDADSNVKIGVLPSGADLVVDKAAVKTDLLIAEGFIEPHFFAGFSGGRKSVLPGVCDQTTVLGNHCSQFIANQNARTGILRDNPIHTDMIAAARMAKLSFIVNVVINEKKQVVEAFAGDPLLAHEKGCEFLRPYCSVKAMPADIVITSNGGAPLDQNIYQTVKGLSAAEATAKKDAVIIMCAECLDGIGGEAFYRLMKKCVSPQALMDEILKTPMNQTLPDQWQYQILARILIKHRVIFVTNPNLKQIINDMKMEYAKSIDEALSRAFEIKGSSADITVIPNGISVIVQRP